MGVFASPPPMRSRCAQDPEALIVLSLEIGRGDARLFDEVLDWTAHNERLLSLRRLRAMGVDDEDKALVGAAARWLAWERPKQADAVNLWELFSDGGPVRELDPSFASAGIARPRLERSGRSLAPDLSLPINLSLCLRAILGVGIRAEVVRILLTTGAPWMTAAPLALTSTYTKRNVHDALTGLAEARVIDAARIGGELRYTIDPAAWGALLGYTAQELPRHVEWGTIFGVLRIVLRWARSPATAEATEYMRASRARQLLEQIAPRLAYAGVVVIAPREPAEALEALAETVRRALDACAPDSRG